MDLHSNSQYLHFSNGGFRKLCRRTLLFHILENCPIWAGVWAKLFSISCGQGSLCASSDRAVPVKCIRSEPRREVCTFNSYLGCASHPYGLCSHLSACPHKVRELSWGPRASLSFQKNKTPYVGCRVENTPLHYLATPAEDVDALRGIGVNGFYSVT